ncbi:MAG: hypothetical protein EON52_01170 [Actinomycetales bacterium]|nr:MAG: hypothetical protein EON52_01170 [Actinomycetales bacterium]
MTEPHVEVDDGTEKDWSPRQQLAILAVGAGAGAGLGFWTGDVVDLLSTSWHGAGAIVVAFWVFTVAWSKVLDGVPTEVLGWVSDVLGLLVPVLVLYASVAAFVRSAAAAPQNLGASLILAGVALVFTPVLLVLFGKLRRS